MYYRCTTVVCALCVLCLVAACGPRPSAPLDLSNGLRLGDSVPLASAEVPPTGAEIAIASTGGPLEGLTISVPAEAHTSETVYQIAYRPVLSHALGDAFDPLTPFIVVDNGGTYASEDITLTIPVSIPDGQFAMPFRVREETGELEGLPVVSMSSNSITTVARRFSPIVVSAAEIRELRRLQLDTRYRPDPDGWPFRNSGSFLTPGGNCSGMTIGSLYYYTVQKPRSAQPLWGQYDNYGGPGSQTVDFWQDDDEAIRLVTLLQSGVSVGRDWDTLDRVSREGLTRDEREFYAMAYAMRANNKPQYLRVGSSATGDWHVLALYGVDGTTLKVADPNYPGLEELTITLDGTRFAPYSASENPDALLVDDHYHYDLIRFESADLYDTAKLAAYWTLLEEGSVGRDVFPSYGLQAIVTDSEGNQTLQDLDPRVGLTVNQTSLGIQLADAGFAGHVRLVRFDERTRIRSGSVSLTPGTNLVGVLVEGRVETGAYAGQYEWVGFDWVKVIYDPTYEAPTPTNPPPSATPTRTATAAPPVTPTSTATVVHMPPPTPAPVDAQIAFREEDCVCPETGAVSVSRAQASTGRNTASLGCRYEYADGDSFDVADVNIAYWALVDNQASRFEAKREGYLAKESDQGRQVTVHENEATRVTVTARVGSAEPYFYSGYRIVLYDERFLIEITATRRSFLSTAAMIVLLDQLETCALEAIQVASD